MSTPADEGILAAKIDDAVAARSAAMVSAIQKTIGALKLHRHWKDGMPNALIEELNAALPVEERVK